MRTPLGKLEKRRGKYPSLGLGYIAAVLEKAGHTVKYIDVNALEMTAKELERELAWFSPELVGLTCTSFTLGQAREIARLVRSILPATKIVVGGPHLLIYPEETLRGAEFDIAVIGEGEYTILELVKAIDGGQSLSTVDGIAYKVEEDGSVQLTSARPPPKDLDAIPFPARHLMPNSAYFCPIAERSPFTIMVTSRGCPYNCHFCLRPRFLHEWRGRSAQNVVDEMEELASQGVREILFYDDTFGVDAWRVEEICDEIIGRDLDVSWDCRNRVDLVTPAVLNKMRKAGCVRIHYGVESGSQRVLNLMRKGFTLQQVQKAFEWTRECGIKTLAYFMMGYPTETRETMRETIRFAKKLEPDYAIFSIAMIYPGTDLEDYALKKGYLQSDVWREYAIGIGDQPYPVFTSQDCAKEEVERMCRGAYREFYLHPSYILRRLVHTRSLHDIRRNVAGLFTVLHAGIEFFE